MKLLLLRHAKSSWDPPVGPDHDRPLAPRGERAADAMRSVLVELDLTPNIALVSTARRTQETAAIALADLGTHQHDLPDLYHASSPDIIGAIRAEADSEPVLIVIGHNPGMHDLAARLSASSNSPAADRLIYKFPTAALAVFECDVDHWSDLASDSAELVDFICPKDLPDAAALRL